VVPRDAREAVGPERVIVLTSARDVRAFLGDVTLAR